MNKDAWIKDPLSAEEKAKLEIACKDISKAALVHKIETLLDEQKLEEDRTSSYLPLL